MASRKEQKEALRREREQREATEKGAQKRRQLIGYLSAGGVALVAVVIAVVVLAGGGSSSSGGDVLPDGGSVPEVPAAQSAEAAAKAADCTYETFAGKEDNRVHLEDPDAKVDYSSNPPSEGNHFVVPAEDGAYEQAPATTQLVHTLEHGRVIVWFKKSLPAEQRANLKALFDEDTYQMVLVPNETKHSA